MHRVPGPNPNATCELDPGILVGHSQEQNSMLMGGKLDLALVCFDAILLDHLPSTIPASTCTD